MNLSEAMAELEARGTEQNRRINRRHGAGESQFGVSTADLKKLSKQIKTDQSLAEELWRMGNADARILATLVAAPDQMSAGDFNRWLADADYYVVVDAFVRHLVSRSPLAAEMAGCWQGSSDDFAGQAGWELLAILAMQDRSLADDYLESQLRMIEKELDQAGNRTRYAMNSALIAIGLRSEKLRGLAEAAARRIGRIEVDHGDTGCKTPDAIPYIEKSWARRSA